MLLCRRHPSCKLGVMGTGDRRFVTVERERDVRTHAYLWHTSLFLRDRGRKEEAGSSHQFRASLIFTAFALEAYLNWLGDKLFPHWDYLERLKIKEKLDLLSAQFGVQINNGARPWQTIKDVFAFRNDLAHGRPDALTSTATEPIDEHLDKKIGEWQRTWWETYCTGENAERAIEDIGEVIRTLHKAAKQRGDAFSAGVQSSGAVFKSPPQFPTREVVGSDE